MISSIISEQNHELILAIFLPVKEHDKKSFLNLEINFFILENNLDFKDTKLKDTLKLLTKNIMNQNLSKNEYFNFTLTKKNNSSEV